MLIDGHSTNIDIEISKLCKDNGVLLYCLPAGPLKQAWKIAATKFAAEHLGQSVMKQNFILLKFLGKCGAILLRFRLL